MAVAHLIDRALRLESLPAWSVLDQVESETVQNALAERGIYWEPTP